MDAEVKWLRTKPQVDRDSGSLDCWQVYQVQFPGRPSHIVELNETDHDQPVNVRCDCVAFARSGGEYRGGRCKHIDAADEYVRQHEEEE